MTDVLITKIEKKFPLIKVFSHKEALYLYDAKSSLITEISTEDLENLLSYSTLNSPSEDSIVYSQFLPGSLKQVAPHNDKISGIIESQQHDYIPRKLSLEVTEDCTLRCTYCNFTQSESCRTHSTTEMSFETAKKAIDYYHSKYTSAINKIDTNLQEIAKNEVLPCLNWWGGEPFCNFKLITDTCDYFESLDWCGLKKQDLKYVISTNLTVLTDEITNFLVTKKVFLLVSMDGSKETHDKNRIFPDGSGSYEIVKKNLDTIISKYTEYARNYIVIQPVIADNNEPSEIVEYYRSEYKINTIDTKIYGCTLSSERHKNEFNSRRFTINEKSELESFKEMLDYLESLSEPDFLTILRYDKQVFQSIQQIFY